MECLVKVEKDQRRFFPPGKPRKIGKVGGPNFSESFIRPDIARKNSRYYLHFKIAEKILLNRYKMEMNLQFSIDDLVSLLALVTSHRWMKWT